MRTSSLTLTLLAPPTGTKLDLMNTYITYADHHTIHSDPFATTYTLFLSCDETIKTWIVSSATSNFSCSNNIAIVNIPESEYIYLKRTSTDYDTYMTARPVKYSVYKPLFGEKHRLIADVSVRSKYFDSLVRGLPVYANVASGFSATTDASVEFERLLGITYRSDETLLLEACDAVLGLSRMAESIIDPNFDSLFNPPPAPLSSLISGIHAYGTDVMRPTLEDPHLGVFDLNDRMLGLLASDTETKKAQMYFRQTAHDMFSQDRVGSGNVFVHASSVAISSLTTAYPDLDVRSNPTLLLPLQYIYKLLHRYEYTTHGLPYYVGRVQLFARRDVPISSNLNLYINALLYIQVGVLSGNIHPDMVSDLCALYTYYATHAGIMTSMIRYKGLWKTLLTDVFDSRVRVEHLRWTPSYETQKVTSVLQLPEITVSEGKAKREELTDFANLVLPGFFTRFNRLISTMTSVSDVTLLQSTIGYFAYVAIFIKGTLDVAGMKNLNLPKYKGSVSIRSYRSYNGCPFATQYDDRTEALLTEFLAYLAEQFKDVVVTNVEEEVFRMQTTAGAADPARVALIKSLGDKEWAKVNSTRIIDFLNSLENLNEASASAGCVIKIGQREQIGRDPRSVTAVTTETSISQSVFYAMLQRGLKCIREMAAGTTTGCISDVADTIVSTSNGNITISLDVSGADKTTSNVLVSLDSELLRRILSLPNFMGTDKSKVFGFSTRRRLIEHRDASGKVSYSAMGEMSVVDSLTHHYHLTMQSGQIVNGDSPLEANMSFLLDRFCSGVLTTSTTHTLRFTMMARNVAHKVKTKYPGCSVDISVLGDDIKFIITQPPVYDREEITTYAVTELHDIFMHFGYDTTGSASYSTGEFLMKFTTLGQDVTPMNRVAFFTEERRNTSLSNSLTSRFDSMISIFQESMSRSRRIFMLAGLLRVIQANLSFFSLGSSIPSHQLLKNNLPSSISPVYHYIGNHAYAFFPTHVWASPGIDKISPMRLLFKYRDRTIDTGIVNPLVMSSPAYHRMYLQFVQTEFVPLYQSGHDLIDGYARMNRIASQSLRTRIDFDRVRFLNLDVYALLHRVDPASKIAQDRGNSLFAQERSIDHQRRAQRFLNHNRATDSVIAYRELSKHGIKVPDSMVYFNMTRERILQAYSVPLRSDGATYADSLARALSSYHRRDYIPFEKRNIPMYDAKISKTDFDPSGKNPLRLLHNVDVLKHPICQSAHDPYLAKIVTGCAYPMKGQGVTSLGLTYENWSKLGVNITALESILNTIRRSADPDAMYKLFKIAYNPSTKVLLAMDSFMTRAKAAGVASSVISLRGPMAYFPHFGKGNPNVIRTNRAHGSKEKEDMALIASLDLFFLELPSAFNVYY